MDERELVEDTGSDGEICICDYSGGESGFRCAAGGGSSASCDRSASGVLPNQRLRRSSGMSVRLRAIPTKVRMERSTKVLRNTIVCVFSCEVKEGRKLHAVRDSAREVNTVGPMSLRDGFLASMHMRCKYL